jgi:hypothetical protein
MPIHKVRVAFLRISLNPNNITLFESILNAIFQAQPNQLLLPRVSGQNLLAIPYSCQNNEFHIGLARDREGTWPMDRQGGLLNPINATALAEKTHFLFLPRRHLLVIAYHGHGPSTAPLKSFLSHFRRSVNIRTQAISFDYIFEKDVYESFLRRGIAKNITLGLTLGLPSKQTISGIIGKTDWKKAFDLLCEDSGGISAEVTIRGPRGDWLNSNFINTIVRRFRGSESTEKLKAWGSLSDATLKDFDLLQTKPLQQNVTIRSPGHYPEPDHMRTAIDQCLNRFQDYLPKEETP